MGIKDTIEEYTDSIVNGDFSSPDVICEKCRRKHEIYKLHESRKRKLRFVSDNVVMVVLTFLLRWKCSLCGATFTQYPPFVLPHKRFVLTDIVQFGEKYLTNKNSSYADAVKNDENDIGYIGKNGLCDNFFSPSSVWRFLQYLSCMVQSNRELFCENCADPPPISSLKYRSNQRKNLLYWAFKAIIGLKTRKKYYFFPNFETPGG